MDWRDLKRLYEKAEEPKEISINKPMRIEERPSFIAGWEKVFPVGEVKNNPPYWRKNGVIISDVAWLEKYHVPKTEKQIIP